MPAISTRVMSRLGDRHLPIGVRPPAPVHGPLKPPDAPVISPILRCPLPVLANNATSDHLRQFYLGGSVPQYRFNPPIPLS